jgi:tetratricopeptide (TPR) repeat protein
MEHPGGGELKAFLYGELAGDRARAVVRHLLSGCTACLVGAPDMAMPEAEEALDSRYDLAFSRALEKTLAAVGKARPAIAAEAHDVRLASLAVVRTDKLAEFAPGDAALADARGRAWMELAHAHRVAGHAQDSLYCLKHAGELLSLGTGDAGLAVRLLEDQASLAADMGQYPLAEAALTFAYKFHRRNGETHLAGRALTRRGLFAGMAGEREQAVGLLNAGLALLDQGREPELATKGIQSLLLLLVEMQGVARAVRPRMEPSR